MTLAKSQKNIATLQNLVPLNTLSEEKIGQLLSHVDVRRVGAGEYLFRQGDTEHLNVYLLSGDVALLSGQREVDLVASGTQMARYALAHQFPRKHSACAKTSVTYVQIDSHILSEFLLQSQREVYEVEESDDTGEMDWMGMLLESPVFQQIPPANLQRVMMKMQKVEVSAGDVIINQGDKGDYFYLISRGMCKVTRQATKDKPPVELVQLTVGQGFGEDSLISNKPRCCTVTMLTDGALVRLSKADCIELVFKPILKNISYETASAMVEKGAVWLDVRTPELFFFGHLSKAINIPLFSLRYTIASLEEDKAYIIYSDDVGLSSTAAYQLVESGFEVYILDEEWKNIAPKLTGQAEKADVMPVHQIPASKEHDAIKPIQEKSLPKPTRKEDEEGHGSKLELRIQELEDLLGKEQQTAAFLRRSLETAENAVEMSEEVIAESEKDLEQAKQDIAGLQSRLDELESAGGVAPSGKGSGDGQRNKAMEKLEKSYQQTIEQLKQEHEKELEKLEKRLSKEHAKIQETLKTDITELQKTVEDLREVQFEMETHMVDEEADEELERLRQALRKEEVRRQQAEEVAAKVDILKRERAVQESATELLEEDLDAKTEENEKLIKEIEALTRQLTAAHEELERARMQADGGAKTGRNAGDVASLQALKQELDTSRAALNEKEQQLQESQAQCRELEDAIEDRDTEIDRLTNQLELLLQKTNAADDESTELISDTQLLLDELAVSVKKRQAGRG